MKLQKLTVDQLINKYDQDQNYLISVKELSMIIQDMLNYQVTQKDKKVLEAAIREFTGQIHNKVDNIFVKRSLF